MALRIASFDGNCPCGHPFAEHTFMGLRCLSLRCRCENPGAKAALLRQLVKRINETEWRHKLGEWFASNRERPAA